MVEREEVGRVDAAEDEVVGGRGYVLSSLMRVLPVLLVADEVLCL